MTVSALLVKEVKEMTRPAGKFSGTFVYAVAAATILGAGATGFGAWLMQSVVDSQPLPQVIPAAAASAAFMGAAGAAFGAFTMALNLAVDTVVGERERHTLETLLAGPLDDHTILQGKLAAIVVMTAFTAMVGAVAAAVTATILYGLWGLIWALVALLVAPMVAGVMAFLLSCTMVAVTMRAKTVKDAGQRSFLVMLPLFFLPQFFLFVAPMLPTGARIWVGAAIIATLILGAIASPFLAFRLFRRHRLIL